MRRALHSAWQGRGEMTLMAFSQRNGGMRREWIPSLGEDRGGEHSPLIKVHGTIYTIGEYIRRGKNKERVKTGQEAARILKIEFSLSIKKPGKILGTDNAALRGPPTTIRKRTDGGIRSRVKEGVLTYF